MEDTSAPAAVEMSDDNSVLQRSGVVGGVHRAGFQCSVCHKGNTHSLKIHHPPAFYSKETCCHGAALYNTKYSSFFHTCGGDLIALF